MIPASERHRIRYLVKRAHGAFALAAASVSRTGLGVAARAPSPAVTDRPAGGRRCRGVAARPPVGRSVGRCGWPCAVRPSSFEPQRENQWLGPRVDCASAKKLSLRPTVSLSVSLPSSVCLSLPACLSPSLHHCVLSNVCVGR